MEILIKIILFFSFILSSHNVQAQTNPCPPQFCGTNNIPIHFPFMLQGKQPPQNCSGFPGFSFTCSSGGAPLLTLPHSGNFSVRHIDYLKQKIHLYDADGCLLRKLMALNLTSSPFEPVFMDEFIFLSCPRAAVAKVNRKGLATVDCLGNSKSALVATTSETLARSMGACTSMFTLPIPVSRAESAGHRLWWNLTGDLVLTWSLPDCKGCEARGGVCGYDRSSSVGGTTCYSYNGKATGKRGLQLFTTILTISIVIPIILCFTCMEARRAARNRELARRLMAAMESRSPPVMVGLDESTIESFEKIVLGQSKRITGPNDVKCPICLVDYCPKDELRCIPECQHCFHSECIDEWLRRNVSCPLCRNSPLHPLEAVSENV